MKYFLIAFLFCSTTFLIAQEEEEDFVAKYHEFDGLNVDGMLGLQLGSHPADANTLIYTLGGFPRYSLVTPTDWLSLSVGVPVQLGLEVASTLSSTRISFASDVPAVVDINIGSQANPYSEYYAGFFVGGGINYNLSYFSINNQQLASHSFGPILHSGIRWIYQERPMGVRLAYMWGFANNVEEDPAIIYEGKTYPTFLSLNITYGIL